MIHFHTIRWLMGESYVQKEWSADNDNIIGIIHDYIEDEHSIETP